MDQEQARAIRKIQLSNQKLKQLDKDQSNMTKRYQDLSNQLRQKDKAAKKEKDTLMSNYAYYLGACLKAINLDPIKDVAIILGSLGLLSEKIKAGKATTEIDNCIKKYKELISKDIIAEIGFDEDEEAEKAAEPEAEEK